MKNTMADLNNHLFEQLERLNDDDLKEDELQKEIERAKAMSGIANNIISNGKLVLEAKKLEYNLGEKNANVPKYILGDK